MENSMLCINVALVVSYPFVALVFSYIFASEQLVHALYEAKYREEKVCYL